MKALLQARRTFLKTVALSTGALLFSPGNLAPSKSVMTLDEVAASSTDGVPRNLNEWEFPAADGENLGWETGIEPATTGATVRCSAS
jgi:hypothetical protein